MLFDSGSWVNRSCKMASSAVGKVLVYGGRGALGATIVKYFRDQKWVCI